MAIATTELELVLGLRERDEEAFEALVESFGPRIRAWTSRHVRDAAEIEDVVQEVLLSVWRASPGLRDDTVLAPWLKTVTDNACRMRARGIARRPVTPVGLAPSSMPVIHQLDVATSIDVAAALDQLPEREAGVLRLLYTQDMPLDQVASHLNVSPDAAKSLAARARKRFRSMFDGWFRVAGLVTVPIQRLMPFARVVETSEAPRDAVKTTLAAVAAVMIAVAGSGSAQKHPQTQTVKPITAVRDAGSGGFARSVAPVASDVPLNATVPSHFRTQFQVLPAGWTQETALEWFRANDGQLRAWFQAQWDAWRANNPDQGDPDQSDPDGEEPAASPEPETSAPADSTQPEGSPAPSNDPDATEPGEESGTEPANDATEPGEPSDDETSQTSPDEDSEAAPTQESPKASTPPAGDGETETTTKTPAWPTDAEVQRLADQFGVGDHYANARNALTTAHG